MDGSTKSFEVDHGTTCGELCQMIKEKLGLKNVFGFSIYVASLEQVSSSSCFQGYFSPDCLFLLAKWSLNTSCTEYTLNTIIKGSSEPTRECRSE